MANNSIALQIQTPRIDLGANMARAAQLRAANTSNALGELELKQRTQEAGALDQYRMGVQGGGDPSQMQALTGYPELQSHIMDSISHLDESKQHEALLRGQKIGRAALEVMNYPVGSSERKEAWNKQLDALKKDGVISEDQYSQWHDNPSDLALHNAVEVGRTTDQIIADRDKRNTIAHTEEMARFMLDGTAPGTIKNLEGKSNKAYWDPNTSGRGGKWRIGYGSDTITRADGSHEPVKEDSVITDDEAQFDLDRRLPEFAGGAASQVGTATWAGFDQNTKNALGSVAYNYGSLPDSVRDAARSGDKERIAKAVEALPANPERRAKEAAMIRGQEPPTGTNKGGTQPSRYDRLLSVASDPNVSDDLRSLATTLLKDEKKIPASYDDLSADDKLKIENAARDQVKLGKKGDMFGSLEGTDPAALQKEIDTARDNIIRTLFAGETEIKQLTPTNVDEVPDGAKAMLKEHPELAPQFDTKYGAGASAAILKGQ